MEVRSASTPVVAKYTAPIQSKEAASTEPVVTDKVEVSRPHHDDFSWGDLGKGMVGATIGAVVDGVAMTAAAVPLTIEGTVDALKALKNTELLGTNLKLTLVPAVALAGIAALPVAAIGSVGYGLYSGFMTGVEDGPAAVVSKGLEDTKEFYQKVGKTLSEDLQEAAMVPLPDGQEPYDIKVFEGVRGLATGVIDGTAAAGLGVYYAPQFAVEVGKALWNSHTSLPLQVGGTALLAPAVPLVSSLGTIGGLVYGAGKGIHDGYKEGFVAGVSNALHDVSQAQQGLSKALSHV